MPCMRTVFQINKVRLNQFGKDVRACDRCCDQLILFLFESYHVQISCKIMFI